MIANNHKIFNARKFQHKLSDVNGLEKALVDVDVL
jgi:hypothetical protein